MELVKRARDGALGVPPHDFFARAHLSHSLHRRAFHIAAREKMPLHIGDLPAELLAHIISDLPSPDIDGADCVHLFHRSIVRSAAVAAPICASACGINVRSLAI